MAGEFDVYKRYSTYLQEKYGERVYKLPVSIPVSCPNRIGGMCGCSYCDDKGAGFENLSSAVSVDEQLRRNMAYIGKRYKANKFIAYFQNFTNTYLPLDKFQNYVEAAAVENIVEISVSTRPDCIRREYLEVLENVSKNKNVGITVELGLQSVNCHTLKKINRGHTLAEYIDAVLMVKNYGFKICTHVILNLPWDNIDDCVETAKVISALKTDFVKLHGLYIVEGTEMAKQYVNGEFEICSCDEYKKRTIAFLRHISPDIYVQRLIGRAPEENSIFANWGKSWWKIRDSIEADMRQCGMCQGDLFDYLGGKAVSVFF
ncbi:MAG: TIGR01212 family radical SAM protein [Firmicutes bacterium]|nr:TIGR01212 family radical SAM protein [Bacillota bacterium]